MNIDRPTVVNINIHTLAMNIHTVFNIHTLAINIHTV